jgi:toxin ParE1/3/4
LSRIVRNPRAIRDLAAIWDYISPHDRHAADALVERIDEVLALLADHPMLGPARRARTRNLRSFTVGRYILLYQPLADGIRLLRVLHGARDLARVTGGR